MEKIKKNWLLILITLATAGLGVIAIITAIRLNSLGTKPVAPTVPKPAPAAEPQCKLTFTVSEITSTPTPTGAVTVTPTPTGGVTTTPTPTGGVTATPTPTGAVTTTPQPTPTPITSCYNVCTSNSDCRSGLTCQQVRGVGDKKCLNSTCETESDCVCNKNCWEVCGHDSECAPDHSCVQIGTVKHCVRYQPCTTEETCCGVPTKPPTTATPTIYVAKVEVPEAGFIPPTLLMLGGGIGVVIASLLLLVF